MGALEWDVYNESMLMSSAYLDDVAQVFREAAEAFGEIMARPEVGNAWEQPSALGGYSVGALVAHVNAAIGWLSAVLDTPVQPDLRPTPPGDYLRFMHGLKIGPDGADRHPLHDVLHAQFERAAARGWESNRDWFVGLVERLTARLEGESATRLLDLHSPLPPGQGRTQRCLLFVLLISWPERRFTLNWNEAARIDWGTILLFGSGIVLGNLMSKTGLAKRIGEGLSDTLNVSNEITITVLVVVIAVLISETTSNTASAAIVVPIGIFLAQAVNVNPAVPGLAAVFGANYGFMLPVSTPPNAIVYSSGYLPITKMIKAGAVFDVIGAVLCIGGVAVMARLVGLTG